MPRYDLAVNDKDENDCRAFIDKESAMRYIEEKDSVHYEERTGRLIKYFKGSDLKTTTLDGEDIEDAIMGNFDILRSIVGDNEDMPCFDEAHLEIREEFLCGVYYIGRTSRLVVLFIDATEEERDRVIVSQDISMI